MFQFLLFITALRLTAEKKKKTTCLMLAQGSREQAKANEKPIVIRYDVLCVGGNDRKENTLTHTQTTKNTHTHSSYHTSAPRENSGVIKRKSKLNRHPIDMVWPIRIWK